MEANEHYARGESALSVAGQEPPGERAAYYVDVAQAHALLAIAARLTNLVGAIEPIRVSLQQNRGW